MHITLAQIEQGYPWYNVVINYLGLFLEVFLLLYLLTKSFSFEKKFKHKKTIFWGYVIISTLAFIITGEYYSHDGPAIYNILFYIVGISYSLFFLNGPGFLPFIQIMIYWSSLMTSNYLISTITEVFYEGGSVGAEDSLFWYAMKRLGPKFFIALIIIFLIKNTQKKYDTVPMSYWVSYFTLAILVAFGSYVTYLPIIKDFSKIDLLRPFVGTATSIGSTLIIYYYFSSTVKQYNDKIRYYLENQQLTMEKTHIAEASELYEDLRKVRHDIKNHVFCMDALLVDKKYDELHEYFKKFTEPLPEMTLVDAGSVSINAILNNKISLAKKNDIKMDVLVQLPGDLLIDDLDMCSVIGNLCDNAIEATVKQKKKEKVIQLTIKPVNNYLSITVKNPVKNDVLKKNPHLHSNKKDASMHGLGIRIVRSITEKYDGMSMFTSDNGEFVASVQLKNIAA